MTGFEPPAAVETGKLTTASRQMQKLTHTVTALFHPDFPDSVLWSEENDIAIVSEKSIFIFVNALSRFFLFFDFTIFLVRRRII